MIQKDEPRVEKIVRIPSKRLKYDQNLIKNLIEKAEERTKKYQKKLKNKSILGGRRS